MAFASITSVDDDMEAKQAVQKVGNKTIFDGLDTKLSQLQSEGFPDQAIHNFKSLWEPLYEMCKKTIHIEFHLLKQELLSMTNPE